MSLPPYSDNPPKQASPSTKNYGATPAYHDDPAASAQEPLLAAQASSSHGGNAWMDQPGEDDLPDDFKVGVAVIDCDAAIRLAFIRKVYSILFVQLLATVVVSFALSLPAASAFMHDNAWIMWIPTIGSFVSLLMVYWKRHQHPANLILLGLFTVFEAMLVGTIVSYYESRIVIQALLITMGVFIGLTLFTFQTKMDFESFGPFLFAGIMGLLTASLVQYFLPFNANVDLAIAGFSVILFSGFIVYDTQNIMKRLSPDEAVIGALSLYLDVLNLFLSVLRVLNNANER